MTKTKEDIISDITNYVANYGGRYSSWYVGISNDGRQRLFNGHNVSEGNDPWIYRQASSHQVARAIEQYFIDICGTDGGTGGGDTSSDIVYAYKKAAHTRP